MSESIEDKIRNAKLQDNIEYLRNAGRKGAQIANEVKRFNRIMRDIEEEDQVLAEKQRLADMAELAKVRRDDLVN